jgi:hypothetical protein
MNRGDPHWTGIAMLSVVALLMITGCEPTAERIQNMIAAQRQCDAGLVTGIRWTLQCKGNDPLPKTCEQPGTEQRPECQQWARRQFNEAQLKVAPWIAASGAN